MKQTYLLFAFLLVAAAAIAQPITITKTVISNTCPDFCNGIIDLTVTGGVPPYTYLWSTGITAPDLLGFCTSGIYTVTITDAQGTTVTSSTTVVAVPSGPTGVSITPVCCFGSCTGSIDIGVSSGTPPLTYLWSNGSITEDLFNVCAGTYTPTITDAKGCIIPAGPFTVTQPGALNLTTVVTNPTNSGTPGAIDLTVTGGVAPYIYTWGNGATTQDVSGINQPGTYCVTVTDSKNCTATTCPIVLLNSGTGNPLTLTAQVTNACGSGPNAACIGSITPLVSGGSGSFGYNWIGPGGLTTDIKNQTNLCAGTYNLVVTDVVTGNTASSSYTVYPSGSSDPLTILSSNPAFCNASAGAGGKCEQLCPNARVTYFVNAPQNTCSAGPPPTPNYTWAVNGAESWSVSPDTKQVNVVWGKSGSGDISVVQSNVQCVVSGVYCINILQTPTAKFATTPALAAPADSVLEICKGQTVFFKNTSLAADLYDWTFSDDASVSSEPNPKHTYPQAGLFDVRMIARTNCLCADTTWLKVRVLDAATPLLDCISAICPGEVVTYSTPINCASYEWSVSSNGSIIGGGGVADDSVTVRWLSGPDGILSLQAIGCSGNVCPAQAVAQVPILSNEAEIRGPEIVCPDAEEVYQITPFDGANYKWTVGANDGTILDGQGTYRITVKWGKAATAKRPLVVEYYNCYLGCQGADTIFVKVSPQFGIVGPVQACDNSNAVFSSKTFDNQNITCEWTLYAPDGSVANTLVSPNQKYTANFNAGPGTYRLLATPIVAEKEKTCTPEADWKVLVQANPQKPFGISGQTVFCPNQLLTFKADGVSPANDVRWQVMLSNNVATDGGTGNPKNFSFNGGAGLRWVAAYQITTDALGCKSDTARLLVKELAGVTVTGPDELCANGVAIYTAPLYQGFDYQWQIIPASAGVIVKGQKTNTLEVQWVKPGLGTAELTVCGKKAAKATIIWSLPEPEAIHPNGLCPGNTATITTVNGYQTYSWQTAGGTVLSSTSNPALGPGAYFISVTDANGCKGGNDFHIDTFPLPNLTITTSDPTGFCNNERFVTIQALTTQDADYQYEWFRNGTSLGWTKNTFSTNEYGFYSCQATNQYGCSATAGTIEVFEYCQGVCHNPGHKPKCQPGDVAIQILPTARCDSFNFKVISGAEYNPGSAQWIFGESGSAFLGSSLGDQAKFRFNNAGQYIIVMNTTLKNGAQCTIVDSVDVDAVARFTVNPACIGDSTRFKDISTFLPDKSITDWEWDFNDLAAPGPDLSTDRSPGYPYSLPGIYAVQLTVTAASGCTSTFSKVADIPFLPNNAFAPVPTVCAGNATPFGWTEPVSNLTWEFGEAASGDKNTGTGNSPYHTYAGAGSYTVTAVPRNAYGCTASYTQSVSISPNNLAGSITPATPAQICEGKTLTLNAPAIAGATYQWSNGVIAPDITVSETGIYSVTITSVDGCRFVPPARNLNVNPAPDGVIKALEINGLGQVTGVSFPSLTVCAGEDVNLKVEANSAYNFSWSGGGTDDEQLFVKSRGNLLPAGTYTYSVTVTNPATGCTAITAPFTVVVNPTPSGFAAKATTYCAGTPSLVQYTGAAPLPGWSLFWNNGEVGPSFTTSEAGKYFVRVVNEFGCAANSPLVVIRPGPNVAAIPGGCHSRCKPDTLCVPFLPGISSWQWYLNGNPIPGATNGQLIAKQSGTYWAVLTDNTGCKAQSKDLHLDLYDGYGTLSGKVWADVNNNGVIDAADTLLSDIPLIFNQNGLPYAIAQTAPTGSFALPNVLSTQYTVLVDAAKLSSQWEIVIGQRDLNLVGCGASAQGDLLLHKKACATATSSVELKTCPGTTVSYGTANLAVGEMRDFTFTNALGCDSIVTVTVTALPISFINLEVKTCPGTAYQYAGVPVAIGETRSFLLKNVLGCDSIVNVKVTALPVLASTLNVKTCVGTTYMYGGANIPIGGSQSFTLKNTAGCDSIVTVNVSSLPAIASTLNVKTCVGTTYSYGGADIPIGGSQSFTLKNAVGCDSVVTVNVTGLPALASTLNVSTCAGTTYTYGGVDIPIGGSQNFTLKNAAGCDSVVTVNVSGLPAIASTLNVKTCFGTTYSYGGVEIPIGGSQSFTLKNAAGCDSIVAVHVSELAVSKSTVTVKACPGSTYMYAGTEIPVGASQDFFLKNYLGCDSVVTVKVDALPISVLNLEVKTCPGTTYSYAGTDLAIGTTQSFTFKNWQNCDSIVTVKVGVLPISSSTLNVKTCPGTTYAYGAANLPIGVSQNFVLKNYLGCDSIVTVNVAALPVSASTLNVKTCPGTTYAYGAVNLAIGSTTDFKLKNYLGCDSVVTVKVAALPISASTLNVKTCPGTTYTYGAVNLAIGSTTDFKLKNYLGCDSVVTVKVAALPVSASTLNVKTCPGTTYAYGAANLAIGSTTDFKLKNYLGCDSVVTVKVAALPVSASTLNVKTCPGTTYTYGSANLAIGTKTDFKLKNYLGCDSVVTVNVAALPVSFSTLNFKVCPGATYTYAGVSLSAGETRDFVFKNHSECDSTVTVSVSAWPALAFEIGSVKSCTTVPNGSLSVVNPVGGTPPFRYSLDGATFQNEPDFAALAPGLYTIQVRDNNGCVFEKAADIAEYGALEVALPDAVLACDQTSALLLPEVSGDLTGLAFAWSNGSTDVSTSVTEAGSVWVDVSNVCQKIRRQAVVRWGELGDTSLVYVPNVFMPLGGLVENSLFRPYFAPNLTILSYSLDVFDRWGDLAFRTQQAEGAWDGMFRDQLSDGEVYPWLLRARVLYCGREISIFKRGDVTVVR